METSRFLPLLDPCVLVALRPLLYPPLTSLLLLPPSIFAPHPRFVCRCRSLPVWRSPILMPSDFPIGAFLSTLRLVRCTEKTRRIIVALSPSCPVRSTSPHLDHPRPCAHIFTRRLRRPRRTCVGCCRGRKGKRKNRGGGRDGGRGRRELEEGRRTRARFGRGTYSFHCFWRSDKDESDRRVKERGVSECFKQEREPPKRLRRPNADTANVEGGRGRQADTELQTSSYQTRRPVVIFGMPVPPEMLPVSLDD